MSDHSGFRATASALLQKNGRSATLSLKTTSPAAKPWEPAANVVVPLSVIMLFFPTTLRDDKGTVIPGNFQRCYFASSDAEEAWAAWYAANAPSVDPVPDFPKLTTKDTITDGGREYQIVRLAEVKPGEQSILFDVLIAG